mmetsp:Transcript_94951/g.306564  ORF Transcript_94951/g.306564 Transcript_94951/m.306564 type:complete len:424 (-) Transcript_94951:100-1371(-)
MAAPGEATPLVPTTSSFAKRFTVLATTLPAEALAGEGGAAGLKSGGCAPVELLAAGQGGEEADPRKSLIYSKEAETFLEETSPETARFLASPSGMMSQAILIFIYMHFDAGLPILQDLYKIWYGGAEQKLLYTKQTLLITQNVCEICAIYLVARICRGSISDCLNLTKTLRFAPAGACFGIQAVFGFLAMSELSSDCYALYTQTSIIVLTLAWTIFFRTRISGTCWISVITIAVGMVGFKMSDTQSTALGVFYVGCKICCQSFACLYAEAFMKTDNETLYIQMAWMKPVELLSTIAMTFLLPPKKGALRAYEEIAEYGFYHHWNWLVVVIVIFNMGDTFMTATIAKKFDSVVKGIAGIFDILYPTQVLIQFINPPVYTRLKIFSAVTILCGSMNFVLAKGEMKRSQERKEKLKSLEKLMAKDV